MVKTLQRLQSVEVGFDENNALVIRVMASGVRYQWGDDIGSFYDRARSALSSIPGVESVGGASDLPLSGAGAVASLTSEARVQRGETEAITGLQRQATTGIFEALGTPILAGRGFQESDNAEAQRVMIINQTMSDMLFPDGDAVGKRVAFGGTPDEDDWHEVVGVVGDVRYRGVRTKPDPQIYQAHSQFTRRDMFLVLRTSGDPTALLEPARAAIRALDPDMPVYDVTTLTGVVGDALAGTRFSVWLFSIFAALALFLASAGIYGVLSFTVAQRQQEIGVRMALGAGSASVTGLVVRRGMVLVGAGLILGALGSLAVSRVFQSLLFEVDPTDVATLILVSAILGGTALLACYVPARRAVRVDPMAVLRKD